MLKRMILFLLLVIPSIATGQAIVGRAAIEIAEALESFLFGKTATTVFTNTASIGLGEMVATGSAAYLNGERSYKSNSTFKKIPSDPYIGSATSKGYHDFLSKNKSLEEHITAFEKQYDVRINRETLKVEDGYHYNKYTEPIVKKVPYKSIATTLYGYSNAKVFIDKLPSVSYNSYKGDLFYTDQSVADNRSLILAHQDLEQQVRRVWKQLNLNKGYTAICYSNQGTTTFIHFIQINASGNISSVCRKLSGLDPNTRAQLMQSLVKTASPDGMNFIFDNSPEFNPILVRAFNADQKPFFTRTPNFKGSFLWRMETLNKALDQKMDLAKMVYVDGLSTAAPDLIASNFKQNMLEKVISTKGKLDELLDGAAKKINTQQEFFDELSTGDHDVMFVFGHSGKKCFYFNGKAIPFEDLAKLPPRARTNGKARVIVLMACNAGDLHMKDGLLFKDEMTSLAQVLIEKNFADLVIAPEKEVWDENMIPYITRLINSGSIREARIVYPWKRIAVNNTPVRIYTKNQTSYGKAA